MSRISPTQTVLHKNELEKHFRGLECILITPATLPTLNDTVKAGKKYERVLVRGEFENFPEDMGLICFNLRNLASKSVW